MKKAFLLLFVLCSSHSFAQNINQEHEIKINSAYTILGLPELAYEYAVNSKFSWGFNFGYATDKDDFNYTMYFQPYYRYVFFVHLFEYFPIPDLPDLLVY